MDTQVRREAVAALLAGDPLLTGRDIARRLNASQTTIRRDLAWLTRNAEAAQSVPQGVSSQVTAGESARLVAALNAELAEAARAVGHELVWSAAEADVIGMLAAGVDRRVELSAQYAACDNVNVKLKIATELRLLEQSIARLYRQVSTEVAAPRSITSMKASRAAHSRWDRERLKQQSGSVAT
jgi:DNA binding protein with HTH domain